MAILRSNVMNNNMMKGFAANMALRDALVHELYKETVVIRKFEITIQMIFNKISVVNFTFFTF